MDTSATATQGAAELDAFVSGHTEGFEEFYFDVCNLDYPRLAKALRPLVDRMTEARDVRITGPDTDLRFSIAGIPVVA